MAFPLTKGLGSCRPTSLIALQRKQEEEVQAKPIAQASAAVSQPSRICFKDIEVSRGCDLLSGQVSSKSPKARGGGAHVLTLLSCSASVCAEVSVSEHHQNHQNPGEGDCVLMSIPSAQHQSVLRQTELVCLSITIITKKQVRGGSCWEGCASYAHVNCLLDVTVCRWPCRSAAAKKRSNSF